MSKDRKAHRGLHGNPKFARAYVRGRVRGFSKDMQICLRGMRTPSGPQAYTHAYFPALAACCGMLEYLAGLHCGRVDRVGWREVFAYAAKYMPQPDYSNDAVRVLFNAFRNPVAHRGIASGVWVDQDPATRGRRLTWNVHARAKRPALRIIPTAGKLFRDPPWQCPYTHRVHIHLRQLWRDIRASSNQYSDELVGSRELQRRFYGCMEQLYPR
jgi:hypothetical protein